MSLSLEAKEGVYQTVGSELGRMFQVLSNVYVRPGENEEAQLMSDLATEIRRTWEVLCSQIASESVKFGDLHQEHMGAWLTSRFDSRFYDDALRSAEVYCQSLDRLVGCLHRHPPSTLREQKLEETLNARSLVAKDIEILATRNGPR